MDYFGRKLIKDWKCAFIFCTLFVRFIGGMNDQKAKQYNVRLRDIDGEDNDFNFGEYLESSIKIVQNDYRTIALRIFCRLQPCSDWSVWSRCGSLVGRCGTRRRARECGNDVELCKEDMLGHFVENQPCIIHIPWCPLEYNYTRHGFCVKLYDKEFKSWYDAQIHCESDGGNLINIDTKTLANDIDEVFRKIDLLSVYAWIDGIKRASGNSWMFRSGLRTPTFSDWHEDYPTAESFPACKCVIRTGIDSTFEWRSSSVCGNRENFICQIKK